MNKNRYRIVFNKARGLRMVVAEKVAAQGKGDRDAIGEGSATGSAVKAAAFRLKAITVTMGVVLGSLAVLASPAQAGIVADPTAPGSQRPTVLAAPNGVPLINIQTPSAAGVSRNTYSQFDVAPQGAILNNSRDNIQTQQGGWVQGNPWLAAGSASIILNEVNSNNPSLLQGYIEVAGSRAQVVIANPSGVTCDGCGFINASRATLTTGSPIVNGGSLDGYLVGRGTVTVQGSGMDARTTDYTDIIARAVQVNAGIWANDLRVTTGANQINIDNTQAAPVAGSGTAPAFAVDVAALGGMYAGKITLIGTEAGVGVRNAGTLGASAGQLLLTADGQLTNSGSISSSGTGNDLTFSTQGLVNAGTLSSQANLQIANQGDAQNNGLITADLELNLNTSDQLTNHQGTLQGQRLVLSAASLTNTQGTIQQTGLQALGLTAQAVQNINGGLIGNMPQSTGTGGSGSGGTGGGTGSTPPPTTAVGGGPVTVVPSPPVALADGVITLHGDVNNDGGNITANGNLDVTASNELQNSATLNLNRLTVSGNTLSNVQGTINVTAATLHTTTLDNSQGKLLISNSLDLNIHDLLNVQGILQQFGNADLAINLTVDPVTGLRGNLDNTQGTIATNSSNLTLSAATLANAGGRIQHAGSGTLAITATTLNGSSGSIQSNGALNLTANTATLDSGSTVAQQISIDSASLSNRSGQIIQTGSGATGIKATTTLDNTGGVIAGNGNTTLTVGNLVNQGERYRPAAPSRLTPPTPLPSPPPT